MATREIRVLSNFVYTVVLYISFSNLQICVPIVVEYIEYKGVAALKLVLWNTNKLIFLLLINTFDSKAKH